MKIFGTLCQICPNSPCLKRTSNAWYPSICEARHLELYLVGTPNEGRRQLQISSQKKYKAGEPGFEPGSTIPKTAVLPLHHSPTNCRTFRLANFITALFKMAMPILPPLQVLIPIDGPDHKSKHPHLGFYRSCRHQ